ncbi:helix-turn-helix domain-containing protein [Rhodobacter maris]|uniref:Helix-turn-helix protein n=1 Tax=Rhodobacter maris TaxID=446682 RepID=A0A285SW45_9RHOB|nr:helix-turn-helix transcriptional regulator [Rhodobacter maris]SOC12854.1 helix-turn-helix protein [Rhodobacter maris]
MIAVNHRLELADELEDRPDYWTQLAWLSAGAVPLLAWRRAAGFSIADLAELSGIPAPLIAAFESRHARPSVTERARLARALGLSPGDLDD